MESKRTYTEATRLLSGNHSASSGPPSYELLVRDVFVAGQTRETLEGIAAADSCSPKLHGKTGLLRTPYVHALIVGDRKLKLGLNWKLPAC